MTEPTADPQPVAVRPLDVFHDEMMAKAAADHQKRMADEAALRDRIAKALSDARRPGLGGMTEADAVAYMADAVLSVLPASAGQADRAAANLTTARATNQRLNLRAQQLESELAAYRRAVADWEITDTSTYVPLRTLAAIGKAAGISVPDRWELHYQRVERAEADRAAVLEEAAAAIEHEQDRQDAEQVARFGSLDHECAMQGEAVRAKAALLRRMAAIPAGSADAGHSGGETGVRCSLAVLNRPHGPHRWEPQPGMDRIRCFGVCGCDHPADEHSIYGCADGCACEWLPKRQPMDPVHILGIEADEESAAGQSAGGTHSCGNCEGIDPDTCLTNPDRTPAPEVVHGCPPDGSGLTPCCGRTPFELPRTDRMSTSPDAVTCTGTAGGAPQPKEARP